MATTTETLIDGLGSGVNRKGFYAKAAGLAQKAVKDQNGDTIDQTYVKTSALPTVDQTYNALSTNAQSGVAVAQAISGTGQVPSVTANDDGKVLKATYSGGTGTFSWDSAPSGIPSIQASDKGKVLGVVNQNGTLDWVNQTQHVQANWNEANSSSDAYIQNKPTIPDPANDSTITVKIESTTIGSFTTNQNSNSTITIPEASTTVTGAMSSADKGKLDGIAVGAQVNVKPNWNAASGTDAEILNKPDLSVYALSSSLKTVATSGSYNDLTDKPTIPTIPVTDVKVDNSSVVDANGVAQITLPTFTQVNSNWTETNSSSPAYIQNKPNLATVATSGSYTDLSNKPTIPDAQVQSDWNVIDTTSKAYIANKPDLTIYAQTSNLSTVATSGSYTDLTNKPTIPDAQVQSDWDESNTTSKAYIANKPNLSTVATSGSYTDLSNKPSIYDSTINVKTGDSTPATLGSFSTNQSSGSDITIPLAASGSSAKSGLMSAADKAKLDDFSAVPAAGSRTGKFMKDDGTWDTPTDTTYSPGSGISITNGEISTDIAQNSGLIYSQDKLSVFGNTNKAIDIDQYGVGVKTDGTTIHTNASGELEVIGGGGSGEVNVVDGVQLEGASAVLPPDASTKVVTIPNAIPTGTTGASNGLITADDQAKLDKATVYQANPYDSSHTLLAQQFYVVTSDQQIIDIATQGVPNRSGTIFFRIG